MVLPKRQLTVSLFRQRAVFYGIRRRNFFWIFYEARRTGHPPIFYPYPSFWPYVLFISFPFGCDYYKILAVFAVENQDHFEGD